MKWKSNPQSFGAFENSRNANEGEDIGNGIEHDPYNREPLKKGGRKAHSLRQGYSFVEFINAWLEQDWPCEGFEDDPEPEQKWESVEPQRTATPEGDKDNPTGLLVGKLEAIFEQTNPEWSKWMATRANPKTIDKINAERTQQAMQCVKNAVGHVTFAGFGQRVHSAYTKQTVKAERQNPDSTTKHHIGILSRIVGDALCEAVVAMANGDSVNERVWQELGVRGGTVVLNLTGKPPGPNSKTVDLSVFDPLHVFDDLKHPSEIFSRSVQFLVGSFFTFLLRRAMRSNESILRCQHEESDSNTQCDRIFVGKGNMKFCEAHEGDPATNLKKSAEKKASRKADWDAAEGDWTRRYKLLQKWFGSSPEVAGRIGRFQSNKHGQLTHKNCSYKTAMKWWKATE